VVDDLSPSRSPAVFNIPFLDNERAVDASLSDSGRKFADVS
jgi:hypothetical protein